MQDAGLIIEMADLAQIIDMQFYGMTFENNGQGKMLLGMTFVLAKSYTDVLSQHILTGQNRKHKAGEALGRVKHGYAINSFHHYVPGQFFDLIKEAWQKRLQGHSNPSIVEWLNEQGYYKQTKPNKKTKKFKKISMTKQMLGKIFADRFYTGYMTLRGVEVCLMDTNEHFKPMVSMEEFERLNSKKIIGSKKAIRERPLYNKVVDAKYNEVKYNPGTVTGQQNLYFRYSVFTHVKNAYPNDRKRFKIVKAVTIVNHLADLFANMKMPTKAEYEKNKRKRHKDLGGRNRCHF